LNIIAQIGFKYRIDKVLLYIEESNVVKICGFIPGINTNTTTKGPDYPNMASYWG